MANSGDTNPIIIDTAGEVIRAQGCTIQSITVEASADAWAVVLHDELNGNVIYSRKSDISNDRGCHDHIGRGNCKGIYATTLTDITRIVVWMAESAND